MQIVYTGVNAQAKLQPPSILKPWSHLKEGVILMKTIITVMAFSSLLALSSGVSAEEEKTASYTSGENFVKICTDIKPNTVQFAWCKGFITGFDQGHTTISYVTRKGKTFDIKKDGLLYCPPESVTHLDAINIIIEYINGHPKQSNLPAGLLSAYALHEKFPCAKAEDSSKPDEDKQFDRE